MGPQRGAAGGDNMNYVYEQFYVSTADDELNYFTRLPGDDTLISSPRRPLPPGVYRVIAGQLYRISPGAPPNLEGVKEPG